MSQLLSLIDQMANTPNDSLANPELVAETEEALRGIEDLEALVAKRVRAMQDRGGHRELGYPNPTALLAHLGRMSYGHARQIVTRANARDKAPLAYRAWEDGRLSTDQAGHVFQLAEAIPDAFPEAEEKLVEIIEPLSVSHAAKALTYWRQSVEGPGELSQETQMIRRGLSLSKTVEGMRRIDGWMTDVAGQALELALAAHLPPPSDEDQRTPRHRRHDALEELARCHLDHENTTQVGGEKPHVTVLTDLDAMKGVAGGTHETMNGDVLDVESIRMLACDASVARIVLGPDSEILDVGRKTRVWSPAQRRAIAARDRHCTAPGCERPPIWCDIHHEDHWADGGSTSVEKGKLLCRFHHTLEHIRLAARRRSRT
jgi:hypothetical protein